MLGVQGSQSVCRGLLPGSAWPHLTWSRPSETRSFSYTSFPGIGPSFSQVVRPHHQAEALLLLPLTRSHTFDHGPLLPPSPATPPGAQVQRRQSPEVPDAGARPCPPQKTQDAEHQHHSLMGRPLGAVVCGSRAHEEASYWEPG